MKNMLITGATGYVGVRLVQSALDSPTLDDWHLTVTGLDLDLIPASDRITRVQGDLLDASVRDRLVADRPDAVIHLAGVLGGDAERDPALSHRVNVDATTALLYALKDSSRRPRFVYASSIATYGPPLPDYIDDTVDPWPVMTYGAHKKMIEVLVQQMTDRGWIDGLALRLPGIVANPRSDARLRSSYLNQLFFAARDGTPFEIPVGDDGTTWLISSQCCVDNLLHAATLPSPILERRRVYNLPAQVVRMRALVDELVQRYPDWADQVTFRRDDDIHEQFAQQPPLSTPGADTLGFVHDGDIASLIDRALLG